MVTSGSSRLPSLVTQNQSFIVMPFVLRTMIREEAAIQRNLAQVTKAQCDAQVSQVVAQLLGSRSVGLMVAAVAVLVCEVPPKTHEVDVLSFGSGET